MKARSPRKKLIAVALFVGCLLFYFHFFTPQAWHWRRGSLQVHVHTVAYADPVSGEPRWDEQGFGWSKADLLFSGWLWGTASGDDRHGGKEFTKMRIVGVSPRGVSVRVVHQESRGGAFNFDKTVFVAADSPARVDVSEECYITAYFEPT